MMSQLKHCDDGPTPKELLSSGHLVENDSIQLQMYKESLETINRYNSSKRPRSAMPESVWNINKTTLNNKLQNLRQYYSEYEIVSEIGSRLNWKRRGFVALLERIP
ncbi:hypothetical protein C1645_752462 [Glomus cerebriforme]|uniref:Uncharacterized protein n=1 Tax=Glomus cerebriforme TaxID=658196 RepID=A0A397TLU9_9GLOM|nr:hypothetical protein C1645_752462 [Glomus cerebriforme]